MASTNTLVDRVKIVTLSSGTGPFQLGAAAPGYRGIEALLDGATYGYSTGAGSTFEVGTGLWVASSSTLVRTPSLSSSGGAAVAFPANIEISFTLLAQDVSPGGALPIVQSPGASQTVAMSQKATTDAIAAVLAAALSSVTVQASATILANQFVNIYNVAGAARVRLARANDPTTFANGYALTNIANGATGTIVLAGVNAAAVAAAASEVWLSDTTAGAFSLTPPTATGSIIQPLGAAVPGSGVFFSPRERVLL